MECEVHGKSVEIVVHGKWVNFVLSRKPKSPVEAGRRCSRGISSGQSDLPAVNPRGRCVREVDGPVGFKNLLQKNNEETSSST